MTKIMVGIALAGLIVVGGCGYCRLQPCATTRQACSCKAQPCGSEGAACAKACGLKKPRLGIDLTGQHTNPDGMTIRDGRIWMSINNLASGRPGMIARITAANTIEKIIELPPHPETGVVSPLGLVFASDGHLYVSDNQSFAGKGMGKSRVLRVVMAGDRAVRVEPVAVGLHAANGIAAWGDSLYVNETTFGEGDPMISGTYRFRLADLNAQAPTRVNGAPDDPHVLFTLKTRGPVKVGANGLCFDSAGNLYVANFGDREIWRLRFADSGALAASELFTTVAAAESVDGMQYDGEGAIWFADFMGNAIFRVCVKTAAATLVAQNPPGDGVDGALDAPSECIRLGNKVYVSNIDLTFGPHTADGRQNLSIIDL